MTSEQLKQSRVDCGLTQPQMANLMGMTQSSYSRIETGGRQPTKQNEATVKLIQFYVANGGPKAALQS